ncbi:sterile alpha motif domain-containing protein 1-like [Triticum urartu]|uniref:sterile alpha motif domain-containing protein 1-like n=1 Tax=Triticum urartu TaxID=4572 RepID=UPI002044B953|nr:sterile alpha motif domain-containing protein 1-like [Triticum urartu]
MSAASATSPGPIPGRHISAADSLLQSRGATLPAPRPTSPRLLPRPAGPEAGPPGPGSARRRQVVPRLAPVVFSASGRRPDRQRRRLRRAAPPRVLLAGAPRDACSAAAMQRRRAAQAGRRLLRPCLTGLRRSPPPWPSATASSTPPRLPCASGDLAGPGRRPVPDPAGWDEIHPVRQPNTPPEPGSPRPASPRPVFRGAGR